ncbi:MULTISPECIES: four-carbon acid sugar kinase family protein [Halomonadaceae]|uniref:Four-carbon acid sugar kinase family protein n=2 Tax=Vreelandella TaxID=3137766 RepID=A0A7Z0LW51_9GAMM|nr:MULTISPECIES: four-carbon acid sugar kinase family protein [Halomonas]NYS79699.1 four-carbon acid sugar kinase family protein [Halomonas glaciei]|tara:strand:+ start:4197 stop:5393 length:1197 start_codon:yes stop_codon:yes gene_type:complete
MSSCRLAIIADDLSGALDTAAPFAARGADARVVISLEALATTLEAWQGQWPAVIAVNTESRHLKAEESALRVSEAVCLLRRVAPQQWFKKVDSTLRGQVVAECKALREALGLPLLLAPAVPAQGRTVRDAEVWVDGLPLAETDYQQDARSAPLAGPIDVAFAAGGLPLQRYRPGQATSLPSEDYIADAESDEELAAVYNLMDTDSHHAMAGAAGLATAMAQRCFGAPESPCRTLHNVNKVLYAVGSRSARAAEQLMQLRQHFSHLSVIEVSADKFATRASNACVVVPESGTQRTAGEVSGAMAAQVASITSHWQQDEESLLFLTGGDIAMAVLSRLGVSHIGVEAECSPGVALGYIDGDPRRRVMTKAGGFGDPQLLVRLHDQFSLRLNRHRHDENPE